ncbi:MAG TPA: ATP-binding protein [Caulobacteraceae bacterium]|jgi:SpoVK/Ycf46/Vps4 family AAA+-type ATPase|nr:ATP-binding protein [Caulobacteraceae bacterium]
MDTELNDLLEACRARPASTALQRALLDSLGGPCPAEILAHFAAADPSPHDEGHRARVARLLTEAGRDEAADRWLGRDAEPDPEAGEATPDAGGAVVLRLVRTAKDGEPASTEHIVPRPTIGFADVGGLDNVKQQIRRKIIAPFEKPDLFKTFRKRSGGGVLMYGPPGCGKTMLARATAGEARAHFVPVAITDVLDKYFGESERKLAEAFAQARARRPSILFFDELEALASRRRISGEIGASLVSTFLNEMDGFAADGDGVLVIGATNTPWAIDSAFRRPGRFDRILFVPPPDQPARLAIIQGLLADRPLSPGLDLQRFAAATSGFSGADLANLAETAVELAIEDSTEGEIVPVSRRHLEAALKDIRPTTAEWFSTARNYAKYANEGGLYDEVTAFIEKHGR